MKYVALKSVQDAFFQCHGKTDNKFWGLIAILHTIGEKIIPCVSYSIDTSIVSDFLEDLFRLEIPKKKYPTNSWSVLFSNYWLENIASQMLQATVNIYDVAVWYFRRRGFDDNIVNADILVGKFLDEMNLTADEVKNIFSFTHRDVSFTDNKLYSEEQLLEAIQERSGKKAGNNKTVSMESLFISANPGELTRAPFTQTLYANQKSQKCLIITQFDFKKFYTNDQKKVYAKGKDHFLQVIYYGAPGTGKSHDIIKDVGHKPDNEKEMRDDNNILITFHPDTDYASFVGCYKPKRDDKYSSKIVYEYQPQAFVKAYVNAWEWYLDNDREDKNFYLIIEELNRGNCAQIFGDMFQLLDREYNGYSSYKVDTDSDLQKYLAEEFEKRGVDFSNEEKNSDGKLKTGEKMILPPNLSILATMNTSDQSLFPMDSAFKRRWQMHYIKIDADQDEVKPVLFKVGEDKYSWPDFVKTINAYIQDKNESTSKQIGQWFARCDEDKDANGKPTTISFDNFCSKVLFYLFNDAFRDDMEFGHLFLDDKEEYDFFFENLYEISDKERAERVELFLENLQRDDYVKDKGYTIRKPEPDKQKQESSDDNI